LYCTSDEVQVMVEGQEETVITAVWVTAGIEYSRVGILSHHMVKYAAQHDGVLVQVDWN
jgi:hypothetical protein